MSWTITIHDHNNVDEKVTAKITNSDSSKQFIFLDPVYVEKAEIPDSVLDEYPDINHAMKVTYQRVDSGGSNSYDVTLSNSVLSYTAYTENIDSVLYIVNNSTNKVRHKPVKGDVQNGGGLEGDSIK